MTPPHNTDTSSRSTVPDVSTRNAPGVTITLTVLVISALMMILNETVLSVALPKLMSEFGVTATSAQWLTTAFLLTMAVVIPTTGFLLQRFRTRQLFIFAMIAFLIGTALAAIAPSFAVILVARVIQALCAAIILPLLMSTTMTLVAPERRGAVMGINSIVISVAPAIGPTLSGIVIQGMGWRWIFGLMLPIVVIVFVIGLVALRNTGPTRKLPLDVISVVLSAFAFGGIVYALANASEVVRGEWVIPAVSLLVGAVALVLFVRRQRRLTAQSDSALLNLRPFGYGNFTLGVVILALGMATMLGTVVVLPLYLEGALGLAVVAIGFSTLPGGLVQAAIAPVVGRLYDRVGPRPLLIPGTILLVAGQAMLVAVDMSTSIVWVAAAFAVFSIGMGTLMTTLMTTSLSSVPRSLYGHGSAIMNTLQQLGGALGTAALVTFMTIGQGLAQADGAAASLAAGARWAFVTGAVIAAVAVVLATFVRRPPRVVAEPGQ
ncbi:MAG: DHA2 family efflux MFS transporter permease subunit [Mycetocola sp.]